MEQIVTQRVNEWRRHLDMSILAFSKAINMGQATLNKQLKDDGCGVSISTIVNILNAYPNLSAEWLMRGEGSMERGKDIGGVAQGGELMRTIANLNGMIAMLQARIMELEVREKEAG